VPPDATWLKPLNHPDYDRLWALCQDLDVPVNSHSGPGSPQYARVPSSALIQVMEFDTFAHRQILFLLLGGVFERYPRLKFIMTEQGASWIPPLLRHMDMVLKRVRSTKSLGELRFGDEHILPKSATEYFHQNVHIGVSQPSLADVKACQVLGYDFFMWGSDYPHDEGTYPFTREHLRQVFAGRPEPELRQMLAGNAASVYDFDLAKLAPAAERFGPSVADIAVPLDRLPEHPNEALLRNAASAA
jgi:predicted TIM-barrel fold metal-dependent hydrolase